MKHELTCAFIFQDLSNSRISGILLFYNNCTQDLMPLSFFTYATYCLTILYLSAFLQLCMSNPPFPSCRYACHVIIAYLSANFFAARLYAYLSRCLSTWHVFMQSFIMPDYFPFFTSVCRSV